MLLCVSQHANGVKLFSFLKPIEIETRGMMINTAFS